jgi:hypothetical protein
VTGAIRRSNWINEIDPAALGRPVRSLREGGPGRFDGVEARALHDALISKLVEKDVLTKEDVATIEQMATDGLEKITEKIAETGLGT